jgi:hypothetical protein
MGKTVESFRMALEGEINRWSGFARALRKPDREAFDELMDMCRTYALESSCATNPIVFEPMVMSILPFQQKRIRQLERELQTIKPEVTDPEAANPAESQVQSVQVEAENKTRAEPAASGGGQSRLF